MNIDAYKSTLDRITETITSADPDFVLDPALDPLSQIAQALPNVIGGGGSSLNVMTTTEFKTYLEEKGWTHDSYSETVDGVEYALTTNPNAFCLPNYPADAFPIQPNKAETFIVVPDGKTMIMFLADIYFAAGDGSAQAYTFNSIGKDENALLLVKLFRLQISVTNIDGTGIHVALGAKGTHGKMDLKTRSDFSPSSISFTNGTFNVAQADSALPGLVFRSTSSDANTYTRLTESKLQALLALLNS